MKCTVERDALDAVLQIASRLDAKQETIPILKHVVIAARGNIVRVSANNLAASIETEIPAEVEVGGSVAVPTQLLAKLVHALPTGGHIGLSRGKELRLDISAPSSKYKLPSLDPEDAPKPLVPEAPFTFAFDGAAIQDLFAIPQPSMCEDKSRHYLCGVYLHSHDGKLSSCATNGFGLVHKATELDFGDAKPVIVPDYALDEIVRLAGEKGGVLSWSDRIISVSVDGLTFASKLIDGTFPDYDRVVPPRENRWMEFSKDDMIDVLDRLNLVGDGGEPLEFSWEKDAAEIEAQAVGVSSGDERLACSSHNIAAGSLGISGAYFLRILDAFRGSVVRLVPPDGGTDRSLAFHLVDPQEPSLTVVQMSCAVRRNAKAA
jgi:DNA polymerase III subunit beta